MKDLYIENYKTLLKEIEEDTIKWKDIPCSWIEGLLLLKYPYHPEWSTESVQSMQSMQWHCPQKLKKKNAKTCMEP